MKIWNDQYELEFVPLFDGALSLRIEEEEIALLPVKKQCTFEDIEKAIAKVVAFLWSQEFEELPGKGKVDW